MSKVINFMDSFIFNSHSLSYKLTIPNMSLYIELSATITKITDE